MLIPEDAEIAALTRDQLASLLAYYAQYPPEDRLRDEQTWGHNAASQLLAKVRELPLAQELASILDELLQSGDANRIWLGSYLVTPDTVDLAALDSALENAPQLLDLPPWCLISLRGTWARAAALGRIPWNSTMRAMLGEVWGASLLELALVHDHAYVLDHLRELLASDPGPAMSRFASAVEGALTVAEGKALQQELRARQTAGDDDWTTSPIDAVQWYIDNGCLRAGPIRW